MKLYIGIFSTHPIQYQVQLWRKLQARDDVRVHVYYASDVNVRPSTDAEFGITMQWDIPMLEGYPHTFMKNVSRRPGTASHFFCVNCPEVKEIVRREPFDAVVIHGYSRYLEWQVMRACSRKGIPVMLRGDSREGAGLRYSWRHEAARNLVLRFVYRRIAIGLAIGGYMRRHFLRYGMPDDRVVFCPNCIDDELFERQRVALAPHREQIRREMGIPADATVMLFSGKLVPRKQPVMLGRAVKECKQRDRLWALILGEGEDRAETERVFKEAIGSRAVFPGFVNQSQLGRYFVASDFFVLPSQLESWGLVVNEAMLMGLPCIVSTRVGCREDLVLEGQTGYSFPFEDQNALTACIDKALENPEHLAEMGRRARNHIERYGSQIAVEGIVEGARRVVSGRTVAVQEPRRPSPAGLPGSDESLDAK